MLSFRNALVFWSSFVAAEMPAQQTFNIELPDVQITANRVVRGDGDTYGLGDWKSNFIVALEGTILKVDGIISFTEKANDFTTITGEYHQRIEVGALERCRHCQVTLGETTGSVSGPNIGARGYRWFDGQGLVRRAKIQTDVFGVDAGNIGGTIQFAPIRVLVDCSIAGGDGPRRDTDFSPLYIEKSVSRPCHPWPIPFKTNSIGLIYAARADPG